jgi:hypothetical protein
VTTNRRTIVLIVLLLAGCSPMQPVFIVNHRDYAVQVTFRNATWSEAAKRHFNCELRDARPRLLQGTDVDDVNWREVVEVPTEFNAERCEIRLTLPPRTSVVIGRNEICSRDREYFERGVMPRLNYLRLESQAGVVELSGWELARALVERRGFFSDGDCRYELR